MPRIPGVADVAGLVERQAQAVLAVPDAVRAVVELARDAHALVRRIDGILDELEGPLRDLAPGLEKLAHSLERVPDTQAQVAAIAATTTRIMSIIDDVGTRMATLPMAPLLSRRRPKE